MNKIILIILFAFIGLCACLPIAAVKAQDTIILKSLDVIIAREIKRADEKVIAFSRQGTYYESPDTNTYTVKKKNIAGIIYHDGHMDKFDAGSMNSYLANRQKGHVLYTAKDLENKSSFDNNTEKASYAVKWNPALFLSNDLAFSFEYRKKNKAAEIELGYLIPTKNSTNIIFQVANESANEFGNIPVLYYEGISVNIFLKHYCPGSFYYGLSALLKYEYFTNQWYICGSWAGNNDEPNINCSQTKEVFGLAFRCGFEIKGKHFIFDPYAAVGLRLIDSKTTYNYYKFPDISNLTIDGSPGDGNTLSADNGTYFYPYLNLGFKIGFGWNGKKYASAVSIH
jgi:hypothetical protein